MAESRTTSRAYAARLYTDLGKTLYENKLDGTRLTKAGRQRVKQRRRALIEEHGPGIRAPWRDVDRANRGHFTLTKAKRRESIYVIVPSKKTGEPHTIYTLPVKGLWPVKARAFDRKLLAQALRSLADRLEQGA